MREGIPLLVLVLLVWGNIQRSGLILRSSLTLCLLVNWQCDLFEATRGPRSRERCDLDKGLCLEGELQSQQPWHFWGLQQVGYQLTCHYIHPAHAVEWTHCWAEAVCPCDVAVLDHQHHASVPAIRDSVAANACSLRILAKADRTWVLQTILDQKQSVMAQREQQGFCREALARSMAARSCWPEVSTCLRISSRHGEATPA